MRRIPRAVLVGAGIALVAGLAVLVWRGSGSRDPGQLRVGECFDVPATSERIDALSARPCSGPHGGEVFHAFDAPAGGTTYPTDPAWEELIYPVCDEAFETYTGTLVAERLDIGYRFLVPTADRWTAGDRRVTCFITSLDGSQLSRSFRTAP